MERCANAIEGRESLVQLGFNRRFDPGHRAARDAMRAGEIGELHQVIITSRDPELPPRGYLESAGGLLRDMTIHDFDLARFLLADGGARLVIDGGETVAGPEPGTTTLDHEYAGLDFYCVKFQRATVPSVPSPRHDISHPCPAPPDSAASMPTSMSFTACSVISGATNTSMPTVAG